MTTKELLKKMRKIELRAKGLSNQIFAGSYKTTFKGRGMSFSEVRQYQYGDDVRNIDWNVTARTNEPYVKVFEEERELCFMLLIDVSASSLFGTKEQSKKDLAVELAATLAFSASMNNDKVGAIFFSDTVEHFISPQKGKAHILRILQKMLNFQPKHKNTDLQPALKYLNGILKKRCTAFILSDFFCKDYDKSLKITAQKHDTIGIHIYDAIEAEMPKVGLLPVRDMETGIVKWVDTSSPKTRRAYRQYFKENFQFFKQSFLHAGADVLSIQTGDPYIKTLMKFFKER